MRKEVPSRNLPGLCTKLEGERRNCREDTIDENGERPSIERRRLHTSSPTAHNGSADVLAFDLPLPSFQTLDELRGSRFATTLVLEKPRQNCKAETSLGQYGTGRNRIVSGSGYERDTVQAPMTNPFLESS